MNTLQLKDNKTRRFSGLLTISLIVLVIYLFVRFTGCESLIPFFGTHSRKEFIKDYSEHHKEIAELQRYFLSIVPEGKRVSIEFGAF